jgi:heme exporter protein CcmD
MAFNSFKEFIEMGGYGFYIWSCYAVVLFGMVVYYSQSARSSKKEINKLEIFYRRMDVQKQPELQNQLKAKIR